MTFRTWAPSATAVSAHGDFSNWVNPQVTGNGGGVYADSTPMHGFDYSAALTLPANGLLVFAR